MKRAAQLIETDEYSMAQIAYMVGLNDSHYFSKCFKQQYGITPTEYKRKPEAEHGLTERYRMHFAPSLAKPCQRRG